MTYHFDNKVDFYITNVCNYTCENCNRFNNHHFTGWQQWSDYADIYAEWAKRVTLSSAVIMGGEPTLNPSLTDWITGLNNTFRVRVQVLTNATRLQYVDGLYDIMARPLRKRGLMNTIGISLHNHDDFETIRNNIMSFLSSGVQEWGRLINVPAPTIAPEHNRLYNSDYSAMDQNGVLINAWVSNTFTEAAILKTAQGNFTLHNNTPEQTAQAFNACAFRQFKSYHFIRGKLYRCAPVALMPEFDQQHHLEISDQDRILLNSYQPLTIENYAEYSEQFYKTIDDSVSQCKFCSPKPETRMIFPIRKGLDPK
jgi:organic radical activating enzyme